MVKSRARREEFLLPYLTAHIQFLFWAVYSDPSALKSLQPQNGIAEVLVRKASAILKPHLCPDPTCLACSNSLQYAKKDVLLLVIVSLGRVQSDLVRPPRKQNPKP